MKDAYKLRIYGIDGEATSFSVTVGNKNIKIRLRIVSLIGDARKINTLVVDLARLDIVR